MTRSARLVDIALGVGVAVLAWSVAGIRSEALAVVAVLAGASAFSWRRPVWCLAMALVAIVVARGPAGLAASDSWGIAMAFVVSVSLGAFASGPWACAGVLALSTAIAWDISFSMLDWLWVGLNLGGVAVISALVARSLQRSRAEAARAGALAVTSLQDAARRAVAEERLRLATDVQQVIRSSVVAMREQATAAPIGDTHACLRAVQREGEQAVGELRRMLGLLRDPMGDDPAALAAGTAVTRPVWVLWSVAAAESACVVAVALLEPLLWIAADPDDFVPRVDGFWPLTVTVVAAGMVGLRRIEPSLAATAFGGIYLVSAIARTGIGFGLWTVVALGLLAWAAANQRTIVSLCALGVMLVGTVTFFSMMPPSDPVFAGVYTTGVAVMALFTSTHRRRAGSAGAVADRLASEQTRASEEAIRAERLSVARELHDVVSHAVVLMVVQAGAADALLDSRPDEAAHALAVIDQTAATTLDELDRLLAAIDPASVADQRSTVRRAADLHDIASRMRPGGLNVRLDCSCDDRSEIDPIAYRIVQESLTNALRHAPHACVTVDVHVDHDGTTVSVVDDGPGADTGSPRGYGLIGLTERVRNAGGFVEIGASATGSGFRVSAHLPLRPTVAS